MQGYYHSVETFGTVDGKGIRYVLFLTGCALGCRFCHNPDTWQTGLNTITVDEVLAEYQKYRPYYDASGGGLTVSGGEPLLQAAFVTELFSACRRQGIHTTLDTAGHAPAACLAQILPYTDEVLFGLKAATTATYRQLCQAGPELVLASLRQAAQSAAGLIVRYILIPGMNDSRSELEELAALVAGLPRPAPLELLPYHTMGEAKWQRLGLAYTLAGVPAATPADVARAKDVLVRLGLTLL